MSLQKCWAYFRPFPVFKSPLIPLWKRGKFEGSLFQRGRVEGSLFQKTVYLLGWFTKIPMKLVPPVEKGKSPPEENFLPLSKGG